jgi:hypothetical protein
MDGGNGPGVRSSWMLLVAVSGGFNFVIVQVAYLMEPRLSDRVIVHVLDAHGVAMRGGRQKRVGCPQQMK